MAPRLAPPSDEDDEDEAKAGTGACDNYRLDVTAANFGDCKCGFPKIAHVVGRGASARPGMGIGKAKPAVSANAAATVKVPAKKPAVASPAPIPAVTPAVTAAATTAAATEAAEEREIAELRAELDSLAAEKASLQVRERAAREAVAALKAEEVMAVKRRAALEAEATDLHKEIDGLEILAQDEARRSSRSLLQRLSSMGSSGKLLVAGGV